MQRHTEDMALVVDVLIPLCLCSYQGTLQAEIEDGDGDDRLAIWPFVCLCENARLVVDLLEDGFVLLYRRVVSAVEQ